MDFQTKPLTVSLDGDTDIIVTRSFRAPPELVWRAHSEPALIQKWMLGPEGWSMPVCLCDLRTGGSFRYEWSNGSHGFHATGEFLEATPHSRIVHVERMFLPDRTPDMRVVTEFTAEGAGTRMVMRMSLPNAEARAAVVATGMTEGMEDSYARLERVV